MSPAGYSGIYYVAQPDLEPSFLLPQLTDTHHNALLLISKFVYCFFFFFFETESQYDSPSQSKLVASLLLQLPKCWYYKSKLPLMVSVNAFILMKSVDLTGRVEPVTSAV